MGSQTGKRLLLSATSTGGILNTNSAHAHLYAINSDASSPRPLKSMAKQGPLYLCVCNVHLSLYPNAKRLASTHFDAAKLCLS
jgi:hypothetical protein